MSDFLDAVALSNTANAFLDDETACNLAALLLFSQVKKRSYSKKQAGQTGSMILHFSVLCVLTYIISEGKITLSAFTSKH